jgi:chromosome segregation ATPase
LADPSRGESLAGLILDLSRIATEEAQAAAAQACLTTKQEAEKEIAELRTSAKAAVDGAQSALKSATAALEQERAASADLRAAAERAEDQLRAQVDALAAREQAAASLAAERQRLEREVARYQAAAADAQRVAADAERRVETERQAAAADAERRVETERLAGKAAAEQAAADLARERDLAAGATRALADARAETKAARKAEAELRQALERAEGRAAALEQEHARSRAMLETLSADLARERDMGAGHEEVVADLQAQLEAERAAAAEWQRAAERVEELKAALDHETDSDSEEKEHLASELERAREVALAQLNALDEAGKLLIRARTELESERKATADLRATVEAMELQLASARSTETQALAHQDQLAAERDRLAAELQEARKWIDDLRAAEAEFSAAQSPAHPPSKAASKGVARKPPARAAKQAKPDAGEEGWQEIRLGNRYAFKAGLDVKVSGDAGKLFDISTTGCQVWTPSTLKPDQAVKVSLPAESGPLVCAGKVIWTRLEPPTAGRPLGYRAGVAFTKVDGDAIEAFAIAAQQNG